MNKKILVEIRASEGGMDSKLLVNDFYDVYKKISQRNSLNITEIDILPGFISFFVVGKNVFEIFKEESGVHRIQRVPPTEKRGRVHTSAITVFIDDANSRNRFKISEKDVSFITTRNSGSGGQRRNKVETCVVATHIPTGISCRIDTRSQYKSKMIALEVLNEKVSKLEQDKYNKKLRNKRVEQIGITVGRGDKRRTYREKDDHVVDHLTGKIWSYKKWMKGQW